MKPWYETHPRELWSREDYRLAIRDGWQPPPGELRRARAQQSKLDDISPLPVDAHRFQGVETAEAHEEKRRRRAADAALVKAGVRDDRPWLASWSKQVRE